MVSLDRYIVTRDGQIFDKTKNNAPIKVFKSNKYLQCCIFDENGKHVMGVHNVVAQALSSDWFDGCVVHHKDNNPHNNHIDNLQCLDLVAHVTGHAVRKYFDKVVICHGCGKEFVWSAKAQSKFYRNKNHHTFCSVACARKHNSHLARTS